MNRFFRYWIPPLACAAIILSASTESFSAAHTNAWLETLGGLLWHPFGAVTREILNFLMRKCAHLIEYGILAALFFRAVRGGHPSWRLRWALEAVVLATGVASMDEVLQTFVPSRTGTWHDVVTDVGGAALAQILIRTAQVLLFRQS